MSCSVHGRGAAQLLGVEFDLGNSMCVWAIRVTTAFVAEAGLV